VDEPECVLETPKCVGEFWIDKKNFHFIFPFVFAGEINRGMIAMKVSMYS
jgi:hypothetical protein